jgi:hypothetical protein
MRQVTADWNAGDRAPEYPRAAGAKTSTDSHAAIETPNEARQGVTGHHVRYVLLFSLGAVVLAFAVIYAVAFWA